MKDTEQYIVAYVLVVGFVLALAGFVMTVWDVVKLPSARALLYGLALLGIGVLWAKTK